MSSSPGSWSHALARPVVLLLAVLAVSGLAAPSAGAQEAREDAGAGIADERVVEILQIDGEVDPPVMRAIQRVLGGAAEDGSELVVLQLDSPAGIAVDPLEIVGPLRTAEVPVVVWVGHTTADAAGAATYLAAAGHITAASSQATIGPACPSVVDRACAGDERALLADLVSDRLGDETDALVAELADVGIDAAAAREAGLTALTVEGLEPLLVELDGREVVTGVGPLTLDLPQDAVTVRFHDLGLIERALHAVLDANLIYLLLAATLLLLLFEVFQPGFGVAGVAALVVAPLAAYGLVVLPVAWWALALIVVGMLLLAFDLAVAGLGLPTAGGAVALTAGSWWLYASDHPVMALSPWLITFVVLSSVIFFAFVMTVVLRAQAGPEVGEVGEDLVGRVGVVRSTMNPEGHVFVGGALWRARWVGEARGRIKTGTRVRIVANDEATLLVDDPEPTPAPEDIPGADEDRQPVAGGGGSS